MEGENEGQGVQKRERLQGILTTTGVEVIFTSTDGTTDVSPGKQYCLCKCTVTREYMHAYACI